MTAFDKGQIVARTSPDMSYLAVVKEAKERYKTPAYQADFIKGYFSKQEVQTDAYRTRRHG